MWVTTNRRMAFWWMAVLCKPQDRPLPVCTTFSGPLGLGGASSIIVGAPWGPPRPNPQNSWHLENRKPIARATASDEAYWKSGSFAPLALPSLGGHTTLSAARGDHRHDDVGGPASIPIGSPLYSGLTLSTCRAHYPMDRNERVCRLLTRLNRASPLFPRVGVAFAARSGFTHGRPRIVQAAQGRPLSWGFERPGQPTGSLVGCHGLPTTPLGGSSLRL